jgi:hypothetical protein
MTDKAKDESQSKTSKPAAEESQTGDTAGEVKKRPSLEEIRKSRNTFGGNGTFGGGKIGGGNSRGKGGGLTRPGGSARGR